MKKKQMMFLCGTAGYKKSPCRHALHADAKTCRHGVFHGLATGRPNMLFTTNPAV